MRERFDVVVVGAGPAGSLAARQCARQGLRVLLVDKATFPRAKVCGCCLNREALRTLDRVGLGDLPGQLGASPLHAMRLAAHQRCATFKLNGYAAVSRPALDAALAQAAVAAGAVFRDGTTASPIGSTHTARRLALRHQGETREVETPVTIVADGLGGRFLSSNRAFTKDISRAAYMGLGAVADEAFHARTPSLAHDYPTGILTMACGRHGYVGLVRLEDGSLDLACAVDPNWMQGDGHTGPVPRRPVRPGNPGNPGVAGAIGALMEEAGLPPIAGLETLEWRGTPWLTHKRRPVASRGIFVIGDAATYVEPFTGEGIGWALRCGEAVADPAAEAAGQWRPALAQAWETRYARLLRWRHWRCRAVAAGLRRPWLMRQAVKMGSRV